MKNKKRKRKTVSKFTFTKVWVNRILTHSIIWIYLSYLLAFLGREEIAQSLAIAVVTDILGISIGYFFKSFFETREEERNKLISNSQLNLNNLDINNENIDEDEEESMR